MSSKLNRETRLTSMIDVVAVKVVNQYKKEG